MPNCLVGIDPHISQSDAENEKKEYNRKNLALHNRVIGVQGNDIDNGVDERGRCYVYVFDCIGGGGGCYCHPFTRLEEVAEKQSYD